MFYLSYDIFEFACIDKSPIPKITQKAASYSSVCVTYLSISTNGLSYYLHGLLLDYVTSASLSDVSC